MTSRLRVCEIIKTLDVGGAEVLLTERLRLAAGGQVDYTVVCLRRTTDELTDVLRSAGVKVVDLTTGAGALRYPRLVLTVIRLAPAVVNVHSPLVAAALRPCLRLLRRRPRLVSTVHSVAFRPATALLDRLTRRLDDQTVAVSPIVARSGAVRGARRLATRIHGVDVPQQRHWAAHSAEVRAELGLAADAFIVVCAANFRAAKNHRLLIQAARRVLRARPDAMFLLAGDGPLRDEVADEVDACGLRERVRILGPVSRARRLVAAADLLVLSSRYEGLPVVVMEALAAGVPVVATAVGGLPDIVHSGRNGILTEPGDADALATGILDAMAPATHRRLRAGAADSAGSVDMAATATWFEELYTDLVADTRHG